MNPPDTDPEPAPDTDLGPEPDTTAAPTMRARVSSALPATADVPLPATADVPLLAVVTVRTASWDTPRDVAAYIQQLIEGSLARLEDTITCATVTHQPPDV